MAGLLFSNLALGTGTDNYAPICSKGRESTLIAQRSHGFGPLLFDDNDGASHTFGIRPFYVKNYDPTTETGWTGVLYPLYSRRQYPEGYRWNVFELLVGSASVSESGDPITSLGLWPFFWHYDTGVPEESGDAVMPVAGTLRNSLFHKRIDWFGFPMFVRLEQQDYMDTCILWPVFRHRTGPQSSGWAAWPIYGHFETTGKSENTFACWPIYYNSRRAIPDTFGGGEIVKTGVLPLFAKEDAPGLESRTVIWPFFGYTTESAPRKDYHEVRYFYPFVVYGDGARKTVHRFLPIYTDEVSPEYRKNWYLWPMLKREDMRVAEVDVHKDTVLYILYKNELQVAPGFEGFKARKTQLWPIMGYFDDGAGKRQFMLLNPFDPIFGSNEIIRETWTPFFAFYRYERDGDEMRRSFLWDLVLFEREGKDTDFSIGPLFRNTHDANGSRWSVAKGLLKRENTDGKAHWSALWGLIGR